MLRSLGAITFLLAGCDKIDGNLSATIEDKPVSFRSAYVVSAGGKGFELYASNQVRSCSWAKERGVGWIPSGEFHASLSFVPEIQDDGSARWEVVGGGAGGDSRAGWGSKNFGWPRWPATVTASDSRCPTRIAIDSNTFHGDFTPVCCTKDVPLGTGPLTARIGAQSYPLARAAIDEHRRVQITRYHDPCSGEITYDDLVIDLTTDEGVTKVSSIGVSGLAAVEFGFRGDASDLKILSTADKLSIHGSFGVRRFPALSGPPIAASLDGDVPLTICPPKKPL